MLGRRYQYVCQYLLAMNLRIEWTTHEPADIRVGIHSDNGHDIFANPGSKPQTRCLDQRHVLILTLLSSSDRMVDLPRCNHQ